MFGYITIDKSSLDPKEVGLYQPFMCGVCLSTKKLFGEFPRNFVSYDINFFNCLFHSFVDQEVTIDTARCIASPFKKRTMVRPDSLTDLMACANVILNYYNLYDDVIDGRSLKKKTLLKAYSKAYKKAKQMLPELDEAVKKRYEDLRELEMKGCDNLDLLCHSFAEMTSDFCKILLKDKANEYMVNLCYNVGKWVYLIDALDDLEKDHKKGNFNPLIQSFGGYTSTKDFLEQNKNDLSFIFYATLNRIATCFNDLNLTKYRCVLNNVIYTSMRAKTALLLNNEKRGKNEKSIQNTGNKQ